MPGGGANIGIGIQRDVANMGASCRLALTNDKGRIALGGIRRLYDEFLSRADVIERIGRHNADESKFQAWPLPTDTSVTRVGRGRVLLVGDAARLIDPMTGEGIGQAMASGRIAAATIARDIAPPELAEQYRRRIDAEIGHDLRLAQAGLRIMRRRRGAEWSLRLAGATPWTRRNVCRWMFEDYPRALLTTPRRWRGYSMRGRGAY